MKKIKLMILSFLFVILIVNGCTQSNDVTKNTISATGTAKTTILPDQVSVYIAIETKDNTAEKSEQENARISDRVRDELFSIGISSSDIQTTNFNVYPEYDYSYTGDNKITGYRTTNSLVIKTFQFSKIGKIIDAGIKGGANRINNIQFELSESKQAEAKKEALERASKDARDKAEAIANGLGVKLGKIVSVSTQDYYYEPRIAYASSAGAGFEEAKAQVDTIIIPRELDTSASVTVAFEID